MAKLEQEGASHIGHLRAPMFLIATSSQANIGGVVSAPIVASVYQKGLAPVGLLVGVLGNILGLNFGFLTAQLMAWVTHALGYGQARCRRCHYKVYSGFLTPGQTGTMNCRCQTSGWQLTPPPTARGTERTVASRPSTISAPGRAAGVEVQLHEQPRVIVQILILQRQAEDPPRQHRALRFCSLTGPMHPRSVRNRG